MAQRQIQHVVEHAIDELPEPFRLVFITRVIEGMNVEETAEILGLKPETVKTRLHRARNMLRDNVEKKIGPVRHGGVSVCRQALRTLNRRGAEAARLHRIIFGNLCASRAIQLLCNQQPPRDCAYRRHRSVKSCSFD